MTDPVLVIAQCRVESTRFYSKVTAPFLGQPLLLWQLDRVAHMTTPHRLVVACPDTPPNHAIADLCAKHGHTCMLVPGDSNDVLGRFHAVAQHYEAKTIVRLVGDTPLVDASVIDGLLAFHQAQHRPVVTDRVLWPRMSMPSWLGYPSPDLTGLALEWGDGQDCAVLSRAALDAAHAEATLPSDREHVEPWIWKNAGRFCLASYACPFDLSWLRCSIDTPEDLSHIERLFETCLYRHGASFGWREVWRVAEHGIVGMKDYMLQRPHNPAYAAQVAQEEGEPVKSWAQLRYRSQL